MFLQFGGEIVSVPKSPEAQSICIAEGSLTRLVKKTGKPVRILSADDGERPSFHQLDHGALYKLARVLERDRLRSLILCPIGEGLGILKIVTSEQGPFLTATDLVLAAALSRKLSELTASVLRAEMLRSLHQLTSRLVGRRGERAQSAPALSPRTSLSVGRVQAVSMSATRASSPRILDLGPGLLIPRTD